MIIKFLKQIKRHLLYYLHSFKYHLFISKFRKKKYTDDFFNLVKKFDKNENFAFSRFSDGEIFILQNKKLEIYENISKLDDKIISKAEYGKEETKLFDPKSHQFYRDKLILSLKFKKNNYFRGLPCLCCNGNEMKNYINQMSYESEYDTFCNLLINGNYKFFLRHMIDYFKKKKIIIICNKNSNIDNLPFKIIKKFNVGSNCFINDYNLISIIDQFILENNIKNHIFLFSASSLSNLAIHQLFSKYDYNTYIDIGSALNPFMEMKGWQTTRGYLQEYWLNQKPSFFLNRRCYR